MCRTGIEPAVRSARQTRDLAIRVFRDWVATFLKHEYRNTKNAQFTGRLAQIVYCLLHGIADENQGLNLAARVLLTGMVENFS